MTYPEGNDRWDIEAWVKQSRTTSCAHVVDRATGVVINFAKVFSVSGGDRKL